MTAEPNGVPESIKVFISYSHDSQAHEDRVLALADRLREKGIDCELDAFEEAPPEGWPAWMARQIREARYVLVICTAPYHLRVTGREKAGTGLGARWEGALITQDLYERGGKNDKFIPVVFSSSDISEIPDFLRHTTRYDLSAPNSFSTLYRRLTKQPRVLKRPLGRIQPMPPERRPSKSREDPGSKKKGKPTSPPRAAQTRSRSPSHLIAIMDQGRAVRFVPLVRVEVHKTIEALLKPTASEDRAYFEALVTNRFGASNVGVAFGLTASWARISNVVRTFEGGEDRFAVSLTPDDGARNIPEMSTSGVSADDIAVLRARRILLDERPPSAESKWHAGGRDSTLDSLVRGYSTLPVDRSPLPGLYGVMKGRPSSEFVAAATLVAVLWLRLTGTVEHILQLDIRLGRGSLKIAFRGQRPHLYANRPPFEISIEGVCALSET
jgi:hypothetical protein